MSAYTWGWGILLGILLVLYHGFVYLSVGWTKKGMGKGANEEADRKAQVMANAELFFANLKMKYSSGSHDSYSWFVKRDQMLGFTESFAPLAVRFDTIRMELKGNGACIVDDVTGELPPACVAALMGGSGAGKTSLLNAMTARASYANVSGTVSVGGIKDALFHFPTEVGFVPQDDVMHPDLTVYENLRFQAFLRLPADMPSTQKESSVGGGLMETSP